MATDNNVNALLTDPQKIIDETNAVVDGLKTTLNELATTSISYINVYDTIILNSRRDADTLKSRMKDTVVMAVKNELQ